MQERLAVVAADPADLLQKLERFLNGSIVLGADRQMAVLQTKTDCNSLDEHVRNYLAGAAPDIPALYPGGSPGRMHVPGYSFIKQRYWFDAGHRSSHVLLKPTDKPVLTEINQAKGIPAPSHERQAEQRLSTDMVNELKQMLADVLYRDPSDIDPVKPFMEQGLDSILGVEFVKLLKDRYQISLRASSLYNYPSLQDLAVYLQEQTAGNIITKKEVPPPEGESKSVSVTEFRSAMRIEPEPVTRTNRSGSADIAVIGIGMRYPEADDIDEFWENLIAGKDCIKEIPKERWSIETYYDPDLNQPGKSTSKWGGFIRDYDKFDPLFLIYHPQMHSG
jgi:acyl transferase domain-containing protein